MHVRALVVIASIALTGQPFAAAPPDDPRMEWWRDARFGMFIHWGLYAIPAGEWDGETSHAEWIRTTAQIPVEEYDKLVERFNPTEFNAEAWVAAAKNAGMKYIVITSKHHDGFCLWDSEFTDFDIGSTPYERDILDQLYEACEAAGIRLCLYHSIMDWHHPDYLPRRDWEAGDRPMAGASFDNYTTYLRSQVTELLTDYPNLGVLWFDGEWEPTWTTTHGNALYDLCLSLNPNIIVNNRVSKGRAGMAGMTRGEGFAGDFGTPEQEIPHTGLPGVDWETCMTMNDHWGHNKHDQRYKSATDLIRKLCDIASKGGNFLLNVGPTAEGAFPAESLARLGAIGAWMAVNGESIYGTSASPIGATPFGRCTLRRGPDSSTLYLHVFDWPDSGTITVEGVANTLRSARLLADPATLLPTDQDSATITLTLPSTASDPHCSVVALEVEGPLSVCHPPVLSVDAPIFIGLGFVTAKEGPDGTIIRYTTDGTVPTGESETTDWAITVEASCTVSARYFRGGEPVSGTSRIAVERVEPRQAVDGTGAVQGLACDEISGVFDGIPDWSQFQATAMTVNLVSPAPRESAARRMTGLLYVRADDVYTFVLKSDDGSRFWIGDDVVIDNDGLHEAREATGHAALARGYHPITVEWFNRTGDYLLELHMKSSSSELREVQPVRLRHFPAGSRR